MQIKDPYSEFVLEMRNHGAAYNPPSLEIGQVTSSNPLSIKVQDLPLTKENLLVADYLLSNYSRKVNIPSTNATGSTTEESITSIGIPDATLNFTDTLKENDLVALIKIGAFYIVLCKVVKP